MDVLNPIDISALASSLTEARALWQKPNLFGRKMADSEKQKAERLSAAVENALARIEKMEDANSLRRMHENIHRHPDLDDIDRERLDEATMLRLRVVSPAIATRLGGPKDGDGRDFLQKL